MKKKVKKILPIISFLIFIMPIFTFADDSVTGRALKELTETAGSSARTIFLNIDEAIYGLFGNVFEVFFNIADSQFLTGTIYLTIFKRLFLIIGVFMLFKLIFSFLTYLISPDAMNDPRNEKNVGKLIGRVIASLLFLVVLMPIGSGNDTIYAKESDGLNSNIREQGILFGTLQSIQDSILERNILGKLILGSSASEYYKNNMKEVGQNTAMTIFSAFYQVNEKYITTNCTNDITTEYFSENFIIPDFPTARRFVTTTCSDGNYLFDYKNFFSTLVGLVVIVIIFLFTFDIALRAIKLSILRLISPIPAISFISPKSAKDGAFANYTKILMNTYLDLFLRVAIIYVVILLLSAISSGETEILGDKNYIGMSKVIVIVALLFFAAQAPKFIMQALGIKSNGTGLGFGAALVGGALAGGLSGLATGGASGAIKGFFGGAAAGSQNQWAAQNGQKPNMSARQAALNRGAQLGSGDPNAKGMGVGSIITGGIGNLLAGTNMRNLDKQKKQFFNDQRDLGDRERIASNLGYGHDLTDQDKRFLENQKYENGNDIVRKNRAGAYEFLDSNGNVLTSNDDMAAALAFDNSEKKKNLGRRQDDLEKAKKQNAYHDPRAMKPKFTAFKRYKGK